MTQISPGPTWDVRPEIYSGREHVDSINIGGNTWSIGMNVEFDNINRGWNDFISIRHIIRDSLQGKIEVQGILLRRTRRVENMLAKRANELCAILENVSEVSSHAVDRSLITVDISQLLLQREVIFTNDDFPSWSSGPAEGQRLQDFEDMGRLVCRWKYLEHCHRSDATGTRAHSATVQSLTEADCRLLGGKFVSPVMKQRRWRTATGIEIGSGARPTTLARRTSWNRCMAQSPTSCRQRQDGRTEVEYSFGDTCAGGGGTTAAAPMVGFNTKFVVDHCQAACATQKRNFPSTEIYEMDLHDFLTRIEDGEIGVDVIHISFPCQYYSPAHTQAGRNDEANVATGFSIAEILRKSRPRIATFEQTSGLITHREHADTFSAVIAQITSQNFSVRWKIIKCNSLGAVQARRRLFLIAACPGEPLPPFPAPTHGIGPGLLPFVTIADRLALRPRYTEAHMQEYSEKPDGRPYEGNRPLQHCITTDGGQGDLHPCGWRTFDMQELALLAGFPPGHLFAPAHKTILRRLIGNAVPTVVMQAIFKEVKASMQKFDAVIDAYRPLEHAISLD